MLGSLLRHQNKGFCSKYKNRRELCCPWPRLENMIHRAQNTRSDIPEESVVIVQAGKHKVVRGKSEEILGKYGHLLEGLRIAVGRLW